ncbi:hypothetical protein A5640_14980 [Mycobacterium asiaticum]|uniref:Uncharacterized protein n=2 Tax=Mycobacterium asiaticum TaxID=1790 RepID=A0A1A3KI86_MYCAS|nr:hypothetical protein A5640_14980 [Mycobacterium asiaticum]
MFAALLFGPLVWPADSETQLANDAESLAQEEHFHEQMGEEARRRALEVFADYWTAGEGAQAAEAAYQAAASARFKQADLAGFAQKLIARASSDVERTKRWMLEENKMAHQEAEAFLRSSRGQSIAQLAVIISKHRAAIQAHSADLHTHVANDTQLMVNQYPLTRERGKGPKVRPAGNGTNTQSSDDGSSEATQQPAIKNSLNNSITSGHSDGGTPNPRGLIASTHSNDSPVAPLSTPGFISSVGGALPSIPGGGGAPAFPMSMLSGMAKFPGVGLPAIGGLPSTVSPPSLSVDSAFGRGLAAGGAVAAAAVPAVPAQPPLAPMVAAPVDATAVSAAPSAASVSAPVPAPAASTAVSAVGAGGLTPYGSVLSPGMPVATPLGSALSSISTPAESGVGSSPAPAGGSTGVLPVGGRRSAAAVNRDCSETDLELARMAVADLAGAACVTDPGLDWAVAVGRSPSSGVTSMWVATNDGASYIPPGVFVRSSMPVAAGFNEDFDARWFGWVNPAEKAVRAARALGDEVSAVATTWAWPSEYLSDGPAVREIATGVPPHGASTAAAQLLPSRSHRLQLVDATLYAKLKVAGQSAVRDYCRELVRRLAFGGFGDELPGVAQAVAQSLVSKDWPRAQEWAALGAEYDRAQLFMGAQRPGLDGVENADQMVSYANLFVNCRRLEALLCWERYGGDLANVVYAAWLCGIRVDAGEPVAQALSV